jgi:hypothetical protein
MYLTSLYLYIFLTYYSYIACIYNIILLFFLTIRSPLKKLNLGKSKITDVSILRMSNMARKLVEIRLQWCCGVTDIGVRALVQVKDFLFIHDDWVLIFFYFLLHCLELSSP